MNTASSPEYVSFTTRSTGEKKKGTACQVVHVGDIPWHGMQYTHRGVCCYLPLTVTTYFVNIRSSCRRYTASSHTLHKCGSGWPMAWGVCTLKHVLTHVQSLITLPVKTPPPPRGASRTSISMISGKTEQQAHTANMASMARRIPMCGCHSKLL